MGWKWWNGVKGVKRVNGVKYWVKLGEKWWNGVKVVKWGESAETGWKVVKWGESGEMGWKGWNRKIWGEKGWKRVKWGEKCASLDMYELHVCFFIHLSTYKTWLRFGEYLCIKRLSSKFFIHHVYIQWTWRLLSIRSQHDYMAFLLGYHNEAFERENKSIRNYIQGSNNKAVSRDVALHQAEHIVLQHFLSGGGLLINDK